MKSTDINIRDPFVLYNGGKYYMYGTRAKHFGISTGGFDVYISEDLENWSDPIECFNSQKWGLNRAANWAPEVHYFNGSYYMFATFETENGLRATFGLKADNPIGPFEPLSDKPLTPDGWECLDGTLYIDKNGLPYLVFCHEHTQIIDGTMCYLPLSEDLSYAIGEAKVMFAASEPYYIEENDDPERHFVTDGPFCIRNKKGDLFLFWSTFVNGRYAECVAKSDNGEITGKFEHLEPLSGIDGGHGMIFQKDNSLILTMHSPNASYKERPKFFLLTETDSSFEIKSI